MIKHDWVKVTFTPDGLIGRSVEDAFRGKEGKQWLADQVTVTLFPNGEAATVSVQGRPLTNSGVVDRRASYSTLMVVTEEEEEVFIVAAANLLKY